MNTMNQISQNQILFTMIFITSLLREAKLKHIEYYKALRMGL